MSHPQDPVANAATMTTEQHLAEVERHLAFVTYPINMNASPVHVQIALTHALLATLDARPQHPPQSYRRSWLIGDPVPQELPRVVHDKAWKLWGHVGDGRYKCGNDPGTLSFEMLIEIWAPLVEVASGEPATPTTDERRNG